MSAISSNYNQLISGAYNQLSSGYKVNSAADNAAALAVSEKIKSQSNGLVQGSDNAKDAQNLLRTAEGGLNGINDALLRIRDLSVQAQSGILTKEDKGLLQEEVGQLLKEITNAAKSTEFNTMKVLDGFTGFMQTGPNAGSGTSINIESTALDTLGIKGYDLTGDFDISRIDDAINMVNQARGKIGAQINGFDHTIASNDITSVNLDEANSRLVDTDMAQAVSDLVKGQLLEQVSIFASQNKMQQEKDKLNIFGITR